MTAKPIYRLRVSGWASTLITVACLCGCDRAPAATAPAITTPVATSNGIRIEPYAGYQPDSDCVARIEAVRAEGSTRPLPERYQDLRVIDIHNHGAAGDLSTVLQLQDQYFIDRTVLFGNISEPAAINTDEQAYRTYSQHPDKVYPFFAGIDLRDKMGTAIATGRLENGFLGIGEIVAASTMSPATFRLPWKAEHPNDGILPDIYELSAKYKAPALLHIDPPFGRPIDKLEQALQENPGATIIFAHANAYNSPANIEKLVSQYPNLYIDFFAGFTAYNGESSWDLAHFVPVMEKYPDQFMVSTDSGYAIGPEWALKAIYELLDLLTPETACKVSHQNIERILESELPTETQISQIEALSRAQGKQGIRKLNKRMANELLMDLQGR